MASNWARMRCRMSGRLGHGELWSHACRKMARIRFSLMALLPIRTLPNPVVRSNHLRRAQILGASQPSSAGNTAKARPRIEREERRGVRAEGLGDRQVD